MSVSVFAFPLDALRFHGVWPAKIESWFSIVEVTNRSDFTSCWSTLLPAFIGGLSHLRLNGFIRFVSIAAKEMVRCAFMGYIRS